jgi:hypothetical protein
MQHDSGNYEPLGESLVYEDRLPVAWRVLDHPPSPVRMAQLRQQNEKTLNIITVLEDTMLLESQDPGRPSTELQHLDFKLNLVMDLLGQLITEHMQLPAASRMRMNSLAMEWQIPAGVAAPAPGEHLMVQVYLREDYPRPLRLIGKVLGQHQEGQAHWVRVGFEGLGEPVQDQIDKLIFRHHRRQVAHERHPGNTE